MGNIEHIDQLEKYISDLGNEINNVKKASEYLKLIEQFHSEIKQTSGTLAQSKDQLKIVQEIVENKLELYQTTSKNIEAKLQSIEQSQSNISTGLEELKQQHEKSEKEITSSFKEINNVVNENHDEFVGELNRAEGKQEALVSGMAKSNKIFFVINILLSTSVLGVLIYLLI